MAYSVERTEDRKIYSRKELEALRYEGNEEQRKKWLEVYCGLGSVIGREYDELVNNNHQQLQRKKKTSSNFSSSSMVGEESSHHADYETVNMNSVDRASDDENSCSVDQGQCMDADDSDEDYSTIHKVAFLVTGEPDFDSGPPEDGLEYLRRVRWEAAHSPKVKTAKVDKSKLNKEQTAYMPQIPEIAKCPAHLMPLKEWEEAFLADFSKLGQVLLHFEMPKANNDGKMQPFSSHREEETFCKPFETAIPEEYDMPDSDGSCQLTDISACESSCNLDNSCFAAVENDGTSSKEGPSICSVPSGAPGSHPTLSKILGMDSIARGRMLREHVSITEMGNTLSMDEGLWLFALCASVDTPIDADTSAALRSLLRKCASLRAQKSAVDEEVIVLNVLATISGRFFGQAEK